MTGNSVTRVRYVLVLVFVLVSFLFVSRTASASIGCGTTSDRNISSVAWSPDGRNIAFVVTRMSDVPEEDWAAPRIAEIWLYRVSLAKGQARLRRLVRLTRRQYGVPVAVFWLANDRIGWAAQERVVGEGFTFLAARLQDGKPYRLVKRRFHVDQMRSDVVQTSAPDDVCWDNRSKQLLFTGDAYVAGEDSRVVCIYDMMKDKLSTNPMDRRAEFEFTLDSRYAENDKRQYYMAGRWEDGITHHYFLSVSNSTDFQRNRVLREVDAPIYFPRVSPDGKWLAWLEGSHGKFTLILSGIQGGRREWLGALTQDWASVNPNWGCPFSWSPSGNSIAMSTGHNIKIIDVRPHKQRLLKSPHKKQ